MSINEPIISITITIQSINNYYSVINDFNTKPTTIIIYVNAKNDSTNKTHSPTNNTTTLINPTTLAATLTATPITPITPTNPTKNTNSKPSNLNNSKNNNTTIPTKKPPIPL
jgi:hypothetical protein